MMNETEKLIIQAMKLCDGCEDVEIHKDASNIREQALQMAVNIFLYAVLK